MPKFRVQADVHLSNGFKFVRDNTYECTNIAVALDEAFADFPDKSPPENLTSFKMSITVEQVE